MFGIKFKLNRFEFFTQITEAGIYSFKIEKILTMNYRDIQIDTPHIDSIKVREHLNNLIEVITAYFAHNIHKIKINTDFSGYNEQEIKIYKALMNVPFGSITTYGTLAKYALGNKANRYVGRALSRNRLQIIVPCHRVVMKDLKIGGFTSHIGIKLKILLLQEEGISINNCKIEHCKIHTF